MLNGACAAADQALADLVQPRQRARAGIAEIDRLLSAAQDAEKARGELSANAAAIADAKARRAQYDENETDLRGEIDELTAKRRDIRAQYGRDETAVRLSGKTLAMPRALSSLEDDLESGKVPLAAVRQATAVIHAELQTLLEEQNEIRRRLRDAVIRRTELDWHSSLEVIIPLAAKLVASRSGLRDYGNDENSVLVRVDGESLRAAKAALDGELAGAA